MRLILTLLTMLALTGPASAQPLSFGRVEGPPVVVLNQERLFAESLFGQRVQAELAEASSNLASENRDLEAALLEEERALTDQRATMSAEDFRPLAEEFDARVEEIRTAQAQRLQDLSAQADRAEQLFIELTAPILRRLLSDIGATAVIDSRAVIYMADGGDITDRALERIDSELGDGGEEPILDRLSADSP